jgi:hypothetical protein
MTSPSETAADHQMMQEYDQTIPEGSAAAPAAVTVTVTDDPQPVGSAAHEYRIAPAVDGAAEEPAATAETEREIPPAAAAPGAVPESIRDTPVATDGASPGVRWHEIQATFVDDPRACVELAAGIVDDSVEALVLSVRERQHALLSGWQRGDAGTEELRVALQQYRTFWNRLEDFSREI